MALQAIDDIGGEKSQLVAAVIGRAFIGQAVEGLPRHQADHRIGDLDFAAGPWGLGGNFRKDFRLQDVTPGNDQV